VTVTMIDRDDRIEPCSFSGVAIRIIGHPARPVHLGPKDPTPIPAWSTTTQPRLVAKPHIKCRKVSTRLCKIW